MRIMRVTALTAAALAMTATTLSAAQVATAADFSVTANGVANRGVIADLPSTSTVSLAVSNLPAGVGLYGFHCLVPPPGASRVPTRCDVATDTVMYLVAQPAAQTVTRPITVNAEFVGKNPNDRAGDAGSTDVNCRVDICGIYTLGAGEESANPAYVSFFATSFAQAAPRMKDSAVVKLDNRVVRPGRDRTIRYGEAVPFSVTLASGLTAALFSKKCDVRNGEIRALTRKGACAVQITSSGNEQYRPFRATVTFKIVK